MMKSLKEQLVTESQNDYQNCFNQTIKLIQKFKNKLSEDEIQGAMESAIKEYFN